MYQITTAIQKLLKLKRRIRGIQWYNIVMKCVVCTIDKCTNKHKARGFCSLHYQRWQRTGDPFKVKAVKRGSSHSHPLRSVYNNMMSRCFNKKNNHYKYYGSRGITVCKEWAGENGFIYFVEDMGERPAGFSLDRIDVNGNYYKENCRWADKYTQAANRQKEYLFPGVTWMKSRKKYRARIKINGKEKHIGMFNNLQEAIKARKDFNLCIR